MLYKNLSVNNSVLYMNGYNLKELAKKYGTPLYVYSENAIIKECNAIKECFLNKYENTRAAYATKAFSSIMMCKIMDREGFCMDVVSGGELYTAIQAGFPAEKIEFNGNNKQYEELEMAIEYGIGRIIVDGLTELDIIEEICKEKGKTEKSAMREVEEEFGFPVYSVVDVYDIIEYLEEDPANTENVERIKNYLKVNGAK